MRLFVSYSHDDKHFVYELVTRLRNEYEHDIWIDRELVGGQLWWDAILANIETCDCFIIFLTPLCLKSSYCSAELNYALALGKQILPLLLKNCDPLPSHLQNIHCSDIRSFSLDQTLSRCIQSFNRIEASKQSRGYQAQVRPPRPSMPEVIPEVEGKVGFTNPFKPPREQILSTYREEVANQRENGTSSQILAMPSGVPVNHVPVHEHESVEQEDGSVRVSVLDEKPMRLIPASKFVFGNGEIRELSAFYVDTWPVTNGEYQRFIRENNISPPSTWRKGIFPPEKANHPVTGVSWYEAMAYAQWANKRLPSAAEWEKAARGPDARHYPWGNNFDMQCCNTCESRNNGTTPINQYPQGVSVYGVIDMAGNVWEWTCDEIKPRGLGRKDQEMKRVLKGGSWKTPKGSAECVMQTSAWPSERFEDAGFRCVQSVDKKGL